MTTLLIAGGKGLIGKRLTERAEAKGWRVYILTRHKNTEQEVEWDPYKGSIESENLSSIDYLVNLTGENIAASRWTSARKKLLEDSRILPNEFLATLDREFPNLKHAVCASGIGCYGFDNGEVEHAESDIFGSDYLSQLVKNWEISTESLKKWVGVSNLRISIVLSETGGALEKMIYPMRLGLGSAIGSGAQWMSWIHIDDLCDLILFCLEKRIQGPINALSGNVTNQEFMKSLALATKSPFWMPNVPSFMMQAIFGEMSEILLYGAKASGTRMKTEGFSPKYLRLDDSLNSLFGKS